MHRKWSSKWRAAGGGDQYRRTSTRRPPAPKLETLFRRSELEDLPPAKPRKQSVDNETYEYLIPVTSEELADSYTIVPVYLPCYISFLCKYAFFYETLVCICLVANLAFFPFDCFFNVDSEKVANFVYYMDLVYALDVIVRLVVEEWRYYNQVGCQVFLIRYKIHYCLMDLISLFPFQRLQSMIIGQHNLGFVDLGHLEWFQTPTLLRGYRIYLYFSYLQLTAGHVYEIIIFVVKFFITYMAFILAMSVVYFWFTYLKKMDYFLLTRNREQLLNTWAANFLNDEMTATPTSFFILTTTFSTVVITTVGYGDIYPYTEEEMFGSILIMLVGAIVMSGYFQSQMTSFCLQLDGARMDLFHRLDGIKIVLKKAEMGDFFIAKVEQYYQCLWTYREGVDSVLFMHLLPTSFQEDIFYDICLEMFYKSYLFHGLDEAFLRSISKIVTIALYNPGMIVCRYGGYANKMFYIIQGECQAMSKHDTTKKAAILRAGSIIGETNLFFSTPYTISVETRSCCQLMYIDKEELMKLFNKFQYELQILRSRCQRKMNEMYFFYEMKGEEPVCWVEIRPEAHAQYMNSNRTNSYSSVVDNEEEDEDDLKPQWPDLTMRWGFGFNDLITEDVILDAEEYVIFDSRCDDKNVRKNHVTPYVTSVVPEILVTDISTIRIWNMFILVCALLYSLYGPYCLAFDQGSLLEMYVCKAGGVVEYINDIVFIIDVIIEVLGAAPVEGLFYRFKDGFLAKKDSAVFYLDLLAALPLSFFQGYSDVLKNINVVIKSTKIWKVIRYLNYLDNVHPRHVFWFRLTQTCLVLVYGIHFIACTIYIQACPKFSAGINTTSIGRDCTTKENWLWSYVSREEKDVDEVEESIVVGTLATKNPYLVSFFYASATLTSAGFGDFSPKNRSEMIWATIFTLAGFFIICYYTSILTSALTCTVKPRLEFQQKLVAVRRFMQYYNLPGTLQKRVEQFYELQHQVRHGINLPHRVEHFMFDSPDYLKDDYLYTELVLFLDSIPLFSKAESKYITKMADGMRRFLVPPNVLFLQKGEVRRAMYSIHSGSVGVYDDNLDIPQYILEATSHFGIRDLLFGEPSHYTIMTLSYCYIYEITNDQFVEVFEEDAELLDMIDDERESLHEAVEEMSNVYSKMEKEKHQDVCVEIPSWIHFRQKKDNWGRLGRQYIEYVDFFQKFRMGKIMKIFLENGTVHSVGSFAKWWSCWMSLVSCLTIMLLFMETFMYIRTPAMRLFQWMLDIFFYVDIYIKLHWGYFCPKTSLLVSHPLKTAGMYIFEGSFFTDVVFCTPFELLMFVYGKTSILGYGQGATWYTKLRWVRFLQIKRIPPIFTIVHGIFVQRSLILLILFVSLTVVACTIVGSVALYIACPWNSNDWTPGDENRLPACLPDHWANSKFHNNESETDRILGSVFNRWIFGLYYVSQVLLVIGFGDMITLKPSELYLLILMSVFGFIFVRCVLADMTSAEVDTDEIRARYTDSMKTLLRVMSREKLNRRMILNVQDHLIYTWKCSKGLQPGRLFNDLYPSLETDLFRSFVGDTLRNVAVFRDFTPNVLRSLCLYLKKIYFLKGERLMRFGNLEYDMYILVSGNVWITDRKLSYGCTLGTYETFGECSMLTYAPRRYSAIAATNVEAFVIARHDFDLLIERYPKVKHILNALLSNGDYDYFEYKIYRMIDRLKELDGEERDQQITKLQNMTNEIKLVLSTRETLSAEELGEWTRSTTKNIFIHFLTRYIIDFGTDDEDLAFLYFTGKRNTKTGRLNMCPPLIHPNCGCLKLYWNIIVFLCFLSPAFAMYEYCFSEDFLSRQGQNRESFNAANIDHKVQAAVHFCGIHFETAFVSVIFVSMITPYQNEQGIYVKDFVAIAFRYIFAIDGMWLDVLAAIPFIFQQKNTLLILLSRSVRLWRFFAYHVGKTDDLSVSPFRIKIQLSVSSFILMAHYIACLFYKFSNCDHSPRDQPCFDQQSIEARHHTTYSWTFAFAKDRNFKTDDDVGMARWRWWLRSLYWVVTVISTTGFGDITPQNVIEMILGIVCFFAGAFILSIILSSFIGGMTSITKSHREFLYQVKLLVKYLNNVGLSPIRQAQTNIYFTVLWDKCRGRMYHEVTAVLPTPLRIEVCYSLYVNVLNKVFLFDVPDPNFKKQVAARVTHSFYLPGVCIVKEGDLGNSMYIVLRGSVAGIKSNDSTSMELKKIYLVGDVFGKLPCLFHNEWYKKSYRAEEVTEVLELHNRDLIHLASVYPEFWKMLKAFVEVNYDPEGDSDCIFSPQRAHKRNIFDLGEEYQKSLEEKRERKRAAEAAQALADAEAFAEVMSKGKFAHQLQHPGGGKSRRGKKHVGETRQDLNNPIPVLYSREDLSKIKKRVHQQNWRKAMGKPTSRISLAPSIGKARVKTPTTSKTRSKVPKRKKK